MLLDNTVSWSHSHQDVWTSKSTGTLVNPTHTPKEAPNQSFCDILSRSASLQSPLNNIALFITIFQQSFCQSSKMSQQESHCFLFCSVESRCWYLLNTSCMCFPINVKAVVGFLNLFGMCWQRHWGCWEVGLKYCNGKQKKEGVNDFTFYEPQYIFDWKKKIQRSYATEKKMV